MGNLPHAYFGSPENKPPDWRKAKPDDIPDDDSLGKTPGSVRKILGFDPVEFVKKAKAVMSRPLGQKEHGAAEPPDEYKNWVAAGSPENTGKKYAIALPSRKGWRRVPDTKFDSPASAQAYGAKYHTMGGNSNFHRVILHPDSFKEQDAASKHNKEQGAVRKDGSVSAVKYKGEIHHWNGADHNEIMNELFKKHGIEGEDQQNREIDKMQFGYYHPGTKEETEFNDL